MRNSFRYAALLTALLAPGMAFASSTTFQGVLCTVGQLVGQATPIVAALALLAFFWGLAMYVFSLSGSSDSSAHSGGYGIQAAASPQGKKMGRTVMLYGIIVLFVMVSIWGIVGLLQDTFGLRNAETTITPPTIGSVGPVHITAPACP